jgi:hypothetical protein
MLREPMSPSIRVKSRLAALFSIVFFNTAFTAEAPDARELLKAVRAAQSNVDTKFTGYLRVGAGSKKIPFVLTVSNGIIRYEFQDTKDTITLRLGEKESKLEETHGGKTERVTSAKFDDTVRDTSITYEDLAMRFLYWSDAKVVDDAAILTRDSWEVDITPPKGTATQYSKVKAWFSKADNTMMKMQGFDADGKVVRTFTVRSGMKREGAWYLKSMDIVGVGGLRNKTELVLDDVVK